MTKRRAAKRCYHFSATRTDGGAALKLLLGGKGANLAEMCRLGLAVPPGFTITTEACRAYLDDGEKLPRGLLAEVRASVRRLERHTGKRYGGSSLPLLLSVRSGAAVSMPGMMDTVLNLGLNREVVAVMARNPGLERFAYDAYRRLLHMFGDVVMGVPHERFEGAFERIRQRYGATSDAEVPAEGMAALCARYETVYRRHVGSDFPRDPYQQLARAIEAVLRSWNKPSAESYRRIHAITGLPGTAVNVQSMVFGNLGADSATGVAFTRDPATGENRLYGEFLVDAQGEDVVAGIRTPRPIGELGRWNTRVARELGRVRDKLERRFADLQDFEFTVERGKLWILQTRTGTRTGTAAVRVAVDMAKRRLIDVPTAIRRITPADLSQLLLPSFDRDAKKAALLLTKGLPASPGAACGKLAFTAREAIARAEHGEEVILVRRETSAEDVDGMHHAAGILTATGGMTSHAAVVARGWGKCCVVGAGELSIDEARGSVSVGPKTFGRDAVLSIDGFSGEVLLGAVEKSPPTGVTGDAAILLGWADRYARLGVRANADSPEDARRARDLGANGIGLCRTEHMFFGGRRISAMREMILAETTRQRRRALAKLLPYQRRDFVGILSAMAGLPVVVRLLDPPLHEFLPHTPAAIAAMARELGIPERLVERRAAALEEANPMLGHRGCRLAITYPEILDMQVRALTEATLECRRRRIDAQPEIMIPLVGARSELTMLRERAVAVIDEVRRRRRHRASLAIPVGTMIEIPRAALTAGEIARDAEFFSFGTNDLTQLTFGYSRDDAGSFLPEYVDKGVLSGDPFRSIDRDGVGQLVAMAVERGRRARPTLGLGVCGEHGGDPDSVRFFHEVGLDYVSCSPFRVPVARLVAAQAALG